MDKDIYKTLYYYQEEDDEGYDLAEVMLLENINDAERLKKIIDLLNHDDKYIIYQAALILISWNVKEGFDQFNQFYNERWDKTEEFEPHRLYGSDNVYDVFAKAFSNSLTNGSSHLQLSPLISKLLLIYHEVFFERNLKEFLLKNSSFSILISEIENAIVNSINEDLYYQASQLFPVMVKIKNEKYNDYLAVFQNQIVNDSRVKLNIEEAMEFLM